MKQDLIIGTVVALLMVGSFIGGYYIKEAVDPSVKGSFKSVKVNLIPPAKPNPNKSIHFI